MMKEMFRRGFTLIELLVVIAIVAVLAVVVVLVLNPASLLQQARDSNRLSDLATVNQSMGYYVTDLAASGGTISLGAVSTTYTSIPDPTATSTAGDQCQGLGLASQTTGWAYQCASSSTSRRNDATGWIPVNFTRISVGSPLGQLPIDGTNQTSTNFFYTYTTNGSQYEITAVLESSKYKTQYVTNPLVASYPELAGQGSNLTVSGLWNPNSLTGYWPLNQTTGTAATDLSGNGYIATITGSSTWVTGKVGNAFQFNGSTYASTTLAWPVASGTIALWTNPGGYNNWISPAGWKFAPSSGGYILIDEGGAGGTGNWRAVFNPSGASESAAISGAISQNQWNHLAMTWNASGTTYTIMLYVNGIFSTSTTWTGTPTSSIGPFYFGTAGQSANNDYTGSIDDLRVYSRTLGAAEVQALYNAER